MKSTLIAYRTAYRITKNPTLKILYLSSTSNLAIKQLSFIKKILLSDAYTALWPEMVNPDEYSREKWTESEISVDHPLRKKEGVREPTIFTAGLTTTITGLHSDINVLDDVVVDENAQTLEGRERVEEQYSLLTSILEPDGEEWTVGTRYHPNDLYQRQVSMEYEVFDEDGNVIETKPLYEKFERQVENRGDGTGQFLWPRQRRTDGKWFGFNEEVLSKIRSQYLDKGKFRAQYYNDPNDYGSAAIQKEYFQYYDQKHISRRGGKWFFKDRALNVFAALDFAFSLSKKADYTALVVVGVDREYNYYVLDIDRFKTDRIGDYFNHILKMYEKWGFRKLRCEVNVAQQAIVNDLKENYIKRYGLALSIEEHRPTRNEGAKEERILAVLQPRYQNGQIWHYTGYNCQILEEELMASKPPHDDVKDSLASAIEICVPPTMYIQQMSPEINSMSKQYSHSRFGGIA